MSSVEIFDFLTSYHEGKYHKDLRLGQAFLWDKKVECPHNSGGPCLFSADNSEAEDIIWEFFLTK